MNVTIEFPRELLLELLEMVEEGQRNRESDKGDGVRGAATAYRKGEQVIRFLNKAVPQAVREYTRALPNADQLAEAHSFVALGCIDFISVRVADKAERTYKLVAILNREGQELYRPGGCELDLRTTDFQSSKEARQWAKDYYHGITVQTN